MTDAKSNKSDFQKSVSAGGNSELASEASIALATLPKFMEGQIVEDSVSLLEYRDRLTKSVSIFHSRMEYMQSLTGGEDVDDESEIPFDEKIIQRLRLMAEGTNG